ncbi:hypothetical protein CFP56_027886 [Quercus suber]|uniref:Uncharacterized protein n=1 Tax=Quercus suber TaxID=58331 RepID=A0AAW0JVC8_QUESU
MQIPTPPTRGFTH